jgi:hypothetical protein
VDFCGPGLMPLATGPEATEKRVVAWMVAASALE